jgi:hypothetical protein
MRNVQTFIDGSIHAYLSTFCSLGFRVFLCSWRWQQAGDALVQIEQEGHAFGVGGVGLFAAAGLVGGVYGGV